MSRQPAPGEHEHFARLKANEIVSRYGMSRLQLLRAAAIEQANGNGLVAAALRDAANGHLPAHHRRSFWPRVIPAVVLIAAAVVLAVLGC